MHGPKQLDDDCGNCLLFGALQAIPDGVVLLDPGGRILHVNPAALGMLELVRGMQAGQPFASVIENPGLAAFWSAAAGEDGPVSGEVGLPEGSTLRVSVSPCRSASGESLGRLLLLRDVSMEKRVHIDLSEAVARRVAGLADPVASHAETEILTRREREILGLIVDGLTNAEIAGRLHVSQNTVASHVKNLYSKIQVRSRSEATAWAVRRGIGSGPA
jgi:DNA-binding CsgD family transcriptional regulator